MTKRPLDRIDSSILSILQSEGRLSNVQLADRVNLSPTPCLERVKRLEKEGYIECYKAVLSPKLLHQDFIAFVTISLGSVTTKTLDAFAEQVKKIPQIAECYMVGGGFDFIVKVRTSDMAAFRQFLGEELASLPEVSGTSTYFVMEEVLKPRNLQTTLNAKLERKTQPQLQLSDSDSV